LGGGFDNSVALGPNASFTLPAVSPDAGPDVLTKDHMFLARLDVDPNDLVNQNPATPVWLNGFWDYGWQELTALAVDRGSFVAIAGNLADAPESTGVDFGNHEPDPPQQVTSITDSTDGFVAKFDAAGNFKWTHRFGGP